MADNFDPSVLFNPMVLWTDLGLRALDLTVSSTQNIGDGVDRLARAGASSQAAEDIAGASSVAGGALAAARSALPLASSLQRSTFDLMTRGWLQWMSSLSNLASLAAGLGLSQSVRRRTAALDTTTRGGLAPSGTHTRASQAQPKNVLRQAGAGRREAHAESGAMEHAAAAAPQRRRRSGRAKASSRSRNA